MAHVDLAKAEFSAVGMEIARAAGLVALAIALVILALTLFVIGMSLFTAEWLLGSMGWGILHGVLLLVAIATAGVLAAVGMSAGRIARSFAVALLIGVFGAIVFALDLPNQLYTLIGDAILPGIEPGVRPLVVGTLLLGAVGLLAGIVVAVRVGGDGPRAAAVVGGALIGLVLGAFTSITFGVQPGVGIGLAIGYAAWTALMAADMARTGIDTEALKARFTPTRTIETSKETLEWLQSKMPPGTGS